MIKGLEVLATVATRWPRAAVAGVVVAAVLGAGLTVFGPLDISTSRRNLLSPDDPGQIRQNAFFDEFGGTDQTAVHFGTTLPRGGAGILPARRLARTPVPPTCAG